ncbi:MAG: hypothetical protein JXA81_13575 [Sedimentisphaerales bacterium]|nr:hypothetical protein [Sedimentisphaerales bacterium]
MRILKNIGPDKARIGIIISSVLLIIGAGFTYYEYFFSTPGQPDVFLKCSNPKCDYSDMMTHNAFFTLSKIQWENYQPENPEAAEQLIQEVIGGMIVFPLTLSNDPELSSQEKQDRRIAQAEDLIVKAWGTQNYDIPALCPVCGQYTVFKAQRCPDCGAIYLSFSPEGRYQTTCPQCGKSIISKGNKN